MPYSSIIFWVFWMRPALICGCSEVTRITGWQPSASDMLMFGSVVQVKVPRFQVRSFKRYNFHSPQYSVALGRIWLLIGHKPGLYSSVLPGLSPEAMSVRIAGVREGVFQRNWRKVSTERSYPLENSTESQNCVVGWNSNLCNGGIVYILILQLSSF